MEIELRTPRRDELTALVSELDDWQHDDGPIHLHPGDLGWFAMRGEEATARALRVWSWRGETVALGLLDGPDALLRLAVAPDERGVDALALRLCADITDPARGVLPAGEVLVEARGATALQRALVDEGWEPDEPWTPMRRDLTPQVADGLVRRADVTVEVVSPALAAAWMEVHWAAFRGTPFGEAERRDVVDWWSTMMAGPVADRGRTLTALDSQGRAVAVAGVWSAGAGRPGLIEPMAVHPEHRGRGYGAAVCEAAAASLQQLGSSSAVVCAETSHVGAVATYAAAGFSADEPVHDLRRPAG